MKRAVIVFTRVPVPGETKTRLMPDLTGEECARIHSMFLLDLRDLLSKVNADVFYAITPFEKASCFRELMGDDIQIFIQSGDDLGEKMINAFRYAFQRGYESVVLFGSDSPEIEAGDIERAFDLLEEKDIAIGRSFDGGYYLIGMTGLHKDIFSIEKYGTDTVFEATLARITGLGLSYGETTPHHDIDDIHDLRAFFDRERGKNRLDKSHTGRYLARTQKISIIVPIYNEEKTIDLLQDNVKPLLNSAEIIFVDGGSTDNTLSLIGPEFTLISSDKGRANQMNEGAKKSSGDVLLFLHADSRLPQNPLEEIREVMTRHKAGAFGIEFDSNSPLMKICQFLSNLRLSRGNIAFGDQGIFIDRKLFFDLGMFPKIPLMEDYQLSLSLGERGIKIGMCKNRIRTSARRYPKNPLGKLLLMGKMYRLRKKYRAGVPIEEIAAEYKDIR